MTAIEVHARDRRAVHGVDSVMLAAGRRLEVLAVVIGALLESRHKRHGVLASQVRILARALEISSPADPHMHARTHTYTHTHTHTHTRKIR